MGFSPVPGEGGGGVQLPTLPPPITGGGSSGCNCGCVQSALNGVITYVGQVQAWLQGYNQANQTGQQSTLRKIFAAIVSLVTYIAHSWLGQLLKSIWQTLKTIFEAVRKELTQIVKLLQQYEKLVRYWEQRILGPIINVIQALRKTLVIFRLFHLKFATQLDNWLSGIEGRLTNIFIFYQRELNYIIDALNLIVDPFGLISEAMFIGSAIRSIGAVWAGVMGYPQSGITAAQNTAASAAATSLDRKPAAQTISLHADSGPTADDQALIDSVRAEMTAMGYTV